MEVVAGMRIAKGGVHVALHIKDLMSGISFVETRSL